MVISSCDGKRQRNGRHTTEPQGTNPTQIAITTKQPKPKVKVYIENSGSMFGFVNKGSEFDDFVSGYLTDLATNDFCDTIKLNYVNSKVIPLGSDVNKFIRNLTPQNFKQKGGKLTDTNLSEIFEKVLAEHSINTVSILISDCIFSPGNGVDPVKFSAKERDFIKVAFNKELREGKDLSVMVYQMNSMFDGVFYPGISKPARIKEKRPYYVWVIGHREYLNELKASLPENKFKGGGLVNLYSIMEGGQVVNNAISPNGPYKLSKSNVNTVTNPKIEERGANRGTFYVDLNVDLSKLLLDDSYLLNPNNYIVDDKSFNIKISKSGLANFTHKITISSNVILKKKQGIIVRLKTRVPQWVSSLNETTFGIQSLVEGVTEAFTYKKDYYTEFKINIE